ncbi:hypothetical protein PL11201_520046 [Planktothrix sp. PCC 11201]|uniref:NACHT domain-containing protein n=1 Tax=Planktothrix sp. PCC 11201 TaxID=1729650 RepID=UPI00090F4104|nr:hypothetical protein [Planktothrix sp. PCC 11201]SKB13525.1 hypothetical protein PL11201_520046 [Planktothrix sp. PCC 11201]
MEPKREQEKRQKQEVNPEDGSQFYQLAETEITKTYNEPNQFFEDILRQGNSKSKGQRLAIIGEPGAGKTTLLYQIARWILQENLGYPILIRLADVDKPIRDYLTQNWLRDATGSLTGVSPEWVAGFEMLITKKQNSSAVETASVREGGHRLCSREFHSPDTYSPSSTYYSAVETASTQTKPAFAGSQIVPFSQQIQEFIEQWFNDKTQSQELLKQLKEPNQTRINDLIKNPLRLALLCRTWKRGQKLPETQAGLYQRLVNSHYQWKDEQKPFQIPLEVQECLHEQHHNTLTPHPEISDITPVGNTPTVRQLEQQITDICSQLPHLPLHCINVNKLLTLNTKNEFIQAFCNRLYQKLLPHVTPPEVQTPANLETKIIHLKQQLQTYLFILLLADGTPTPEVIDCCDYLTDVLHLGWITPDPLPLPPPQRSFVASQENLLEAVESWVAEY